MNTAPNYLWGKKTPKTMKQNVIRKNNMIQKSNDQKESKLYLTPEVAANFIQILPSNPAEILPAPCDFMVDNFNRNLKSTLDSVAPLLTKTIKTKPTPP